MAKKYRPWLKAFSAIFSNISAAFFITPLIGSAISFPENHVNFLALTLDIVFGIVFLLLTVLCEKTLEE